MRNIASRSFKVTIYATAALLLAAVAITIALEAAPSNMSVVRAPVYEFELDIFKTILAGFIVTMLGVLIPAVAGEAKERYEQRKESRAAYSEAKTGVDYLKLRLAASRFADASAALQSVHYHKHLAQLFEDLPEWIRMRYGDDTTPDDWDVLLYQQLFDARVVLEQNAGRWDGLDPSERIALLDRALPTISLLPPK